MGRVAAPEMKLIVKRTFLEFVEEGGVDGSLRPRSFTDSAVHLTASDQNQVEVEAAKDITNQPLGTNGKHVNQSATQELKAFLGLGHADELPNMPPAKLPGSPCKRSPMRTPLLPVLPEEEQPLENHRSWPQVPSASSQPQAMESMAPFTLPQCSMATCWVPVSVDTKAVLQISNMITPPTNMESQNGYYNTVPQQWLGFGAFACQVPYEADVNVGQSSVEAQKTTVILRNLPNNYSRTMLQNLLDTEGFAMKYDFVYIPVDFNSHAGLGYAFVNMVSPHDALALWEHFEGFRRWSIPSEKVCALNWATPIQGLAAHVERYRNSPVMHEAVPDEWKPALYYAGERLAFPPPTKTIKAPKIRNSCH